MKLYDKAGISVVDINPSKEINRGGEGSIYEHPKDSSQVIKVYHPGIKPSINQKFLSEISGLSSNFVRPLEIYYTKSKAVAGYSMIYLNTNKLFLLSNILSKSLCQKENFDIDFKIKIFLKIKELLLEAHKNNVIIGDLNPYNIFFSKKGDVFFIDTDSYQTLSKPHSDILLPEIRDWLSQKVSEQTDFYAYAILSFQMFTYLHPFKGIHNKVSSLEERSVKHLSVLLNTKDIIIPAFYQPLTDSLLKDQYWKIFQDGKRFLIDIINTPVSIKRQSPVVITGNLQIRLISEDCNYFYTSKTNLAVITSNSTLVFNCLTKGVISSPKTIKKHPNILFGNNTMYTYDSPHFCKITENRIEFWDNIRTSDEYLSYNEYLMFLENDCYKIYNLKEEFNNSINFAEGVIYTKSVHIKTGCAIQVISGMKWLLTIDNGNLLTIRTNLDIRDAIYRSGVFMLEIKNGKNIEYVLAKKKGMSLEIASEKFNSLRFFDVVDNNILIAGNQKIEVFSLNGMYKIAEIDCSVITEQSIIQHTISGIVCQTEEFLYLINK